MTDRELFPPRPHRADRTAQSIHDLAPQLATNRRFWLDWDTGHAPADPDNDLPIYRTDIPHSLMNGVMRIRGLSLDAAIAEAMDRLTGCTWAWWVSDDSDPGTAERLLERGAREIGAMPIMAIDTATVGEQPALEGLHIERAVDRSAVAAYVDAYAEPLGFPASSRDAMVELELACSPAASHRIRLAGLVDGRTVATTTLSLATEVAGVYVVATEEAHRGRGIATALTLEALRLAREAGHRIATLQASGLGEPIYRRIGFETVGRYRLFELPTVGEPTD